MQRTELQASDHVPDLIEWRIRAVERATNFSFCILALEVHSIDKELNRFIRRHLSQVEAQREDDSRAPVHSPEQGANTVLWRNVEVVIPREHLPVQRLSLAPERSVESLTPRVVSVRHEPLQVMTGIQLVEYCRM